MPLHRRTVSFFRACARQALPLGAVVLALAATPAAAQTWSVFAPGSSGTVLNGTLRGVAITWRSAFVSGAPSTGSAMVVTPSVNPPFNTYDIWDNGVPANSAQIYPATLKGFQQVVLTSRGDSTLANPNRVTVSFAQPMVDPVVAMYSLDNSTVDFSPTRAAGGVVPAVTFATNNAALLNPAARTVSATVAGGQEGCPNETPPRKACLVARFQGIFTEVAFDVTSNDGGSDGIGVQVGAADVPASLATSGIPALSPAALALLALLLAVGGGMAQRGRRR